MHIEAPGAAALRAGLVAGPPGHKKTRNIAIRVFAAALVCISDIQVNGRLTLRVLVRRS